MRTQTNHIEQQACDDRQGGGRSKIRMAGNSIRGKAGWVDRAVLRDPSWWHWTACVVLLTAHFARCRGAMEVALVATWMMAAYFAWRLRAWQPFPVQVRLAYGSLLAAGCLPGLGWLHIVQFLGTSAMIMVGYCPLARLLTLAPWNRPGPLSWTAIRYALIEQPMAGGLLAWRGAEAVPSVCSLRHEECRLPAAK